MNDLNAYQVAALRTDVLDRPQRERLSNHALGLAGEAGEAVDLVKKHLHHGHALDLERLKGELGDVLWYVAALADAAGLTLEEVAQHNVEKLRARYPDEGFDPARSQAREVAVVLAARSGRVWVGTAARDVRITGAVMVEADAPRMGARRLTEEEDAALAAELRASSHARADGGGGMSDHNNSVAQHWATQEAQNG